MASQQERKFRFFPRLRKESQMKTDWQEFSFQIGRIMVGGDFNSQNPNVSDVGIEKWLDIMADQRKLRKEGVQYLKGGIISVAQERKGTPREYYEDGQVMPLRNVAYFLDDVIKPKIGKRGKHGNESMATLKELTASLFYCDKNPLSIKNIIRPFALKSLRG